jgi:hemolysin III
VAGGVVYPTGISIYHTKRIPYHKAIWHAFVLVAAVLHFSAISFEFAR